MEPSSRQASSSPSGAHRVHRAGEGVQSGGQRPPGKGPFPSEMTNGFPQLQTSARAHSCVQRPCGFQEDDGALVCWEGGLAWLPSDPTLTLQFQGLREAQRQELSHGSRDTEVQRQMEKGRHVWPQRQRQTKSQTEKLRETCRRRQKGDRGSTPEPKHLEGGVESLRNRARQRERTPATMKAMGWR